MSAVVAFPIVADATRVLCHYILMRLNSAEEYGHIVVLSSYSGVFVSLLVPVVLAVFLVRLRPANSLNDGS